MTDEMDMDYENWPDEGALAELKPYVQTLEDRLDTHRTNVTRILALPPSQGSNAAVQGSGFKTTTLAVAAADDTADETWTMLHDEWEDYGQEAGKKARITRRSSHRYRQTRRLLESTQ